MVPTTGNSAPEQELQRARRYARRLGRSVFLFHDGRQWRLHTDIEAVPMSGATVEIHPEHPAGEEMTNRGGC